MPDRLTSFMGRQGEIAEVAELVLTKRLVTLSGPGGIGKTSLALEWRSFSNRDSETECGSSNWPRCKMANS